MLSKETTPLKQKKLEWATRQSMLVAHVTPYDQQFRMLMGDARGLMMQGGADASTASMQSMSAIYNLVQRQASLLSFAETFRVMGVLFMLCILAVLIMKKPAHKRSVDGVPPQQPQLQRLPGTPARSG
jgi:DHA2 family multidrug resistance protein